MIANKIGYKVIIAVGLIAIAGIVIFSYLMISAQNTAMVFQVERNAQHLSDMVKGSTRYDMLLNQTDHVHRIIDSIGEQQGIDKIRVFNKEGRIIYAAAKDEIGTMVDKRAEACYACHTEDQALERLSIQERTRIFKEADDTRTLGIINPIYNEPACWQADCHAHEANQKVLGVLDITMSLTEVDEQIQTNTLRVVVFSLVAIIGVSLILWFLVQQLVSKPVNELVTATKIVAEGDLSHKIKIKSKDELGNLAHSFNQMTEKLAEAQRQIYQQDKLASLGRLAAGVAHEINNPLTGVLTYSSFLLKRAKEDEEAKEDLNVIVRETKRCREIVKSLLDFARQAPTKKSHVSINEILKRSLTIVDNQLSINKVTVEKKLAENLPEVVADGNQIQQVFINLIVNSSDAIGPAGGTMHIQTQVIEKNGDTFVQIKISDTGCGIPQEKLDKIFEPFYTTKGQKGTGLGLAVVWGIIDKHGGKISVESQIDKGTTFVIDLPLAGAEKTAPLIKE